MAKQSQRNEARREEAEDFLREFAASLNDDLEDLSLDIQSFPDKPVSGRAAFSRYLRQKLGFLQRFAVAKKAKYFNRRIRIAKVRAATAKARELIITEPPTERMVPSGLRAPLEEALGEIAAWSQQTLEQKAEAKDWAPDLSALEAQGVAAETIGKLLAVRDLAVKERISEGQRRNHYFSILQPEKERALADLVTNIKQDLLADIIAKYVRRRGLQDDDDAEAIADFYIHYAIFTEYFKSMKLLYQVLLKEYEELSLLDSDQITYLRHDAVRKITASLIDRSWKGPHGAARRQDFRDERLKEIRTKLHEEMESTGEKISALCFSGGGIRSATFCLGVIQALARHQLLDKFDYLSTVSGGGYIGSWLTAWSHRTPGKTTAVQKKLVELDIGEVEPPQVTHLRSYSNYMSPRLGLLSADTWTLVGVYLRNLILNWTVVVPIVAAILLVPKLVVEALKHGDLWVGKPPSFWSTAIMVISGLLGVLAIFTATAFRPSLAEGIPKDSFFSQHFRRDDIGTAKTVGSKLFALAIMPMLLFSVGVTTFWYWGPKGERLVIVQSLHEYLNNNPIVLVVVFVLVAVTFGVPTLFNLFRKGQTGWEKFFTVVVSVMCVAMGAFQVWILSRSVVPFALVLSAEITFLAGWAIARAVLFILRKKNGAVVVGQNTFNDFSISFLAASFGGLLLYAATRSLFPIETLGGPISPTFYATLSVPVFLSVFLLSSTIFVGIASKVLDDGDREWLSRLGAWMLIAIVAWLALFGLVLHGREIVKGAQGFVQPLILSTGGIVGVITLLYGFYSKALPETAGSSQKKSLIPTLITKVGAPLFAVFLLILVVIGTEEVMAAVGAKVPELNFESAAYHSGGQSVGILLFWIAALLGIGCIMGLWININKFSLHGTYRERLIRAYLGASRGAERFNTANSFTGLDDADNVNLSSIEHKPFHVVNMTLNVAKASNLRWQNRKAESFTMTPFHCGSSNMGEAAAIIAAQECTVPTSRARPYHWAPPPPFPAPPRARIWAITRSRRRSRR